MKYVAFVGLLLLVYPLGLLARRRATVRWWLAVLMGFLPFYHVHITFLFMPIRGPSGSRGFEVTLLDLVGLALLVALPRKRFPAPLRIARLIYFVAASASLLFGLVPLYVAFELWKLLRLYRIGSTVAHAAETPALAPAIVRGLFAGVWYTAGLQLFQRYAHGDVQPFGPFEHENNVALTSNMIFPAALALTLAGRGGKGALITVAAAGIADILALSRGGLATSVVAAIIVFSGSSFRAFSPRKIKVFIGSMLVGGLALAKSLDTIIQRFVGAPEASGEARVKFIEAAKLMLAEHPFGVGFNNFAYAHESLGYGVRTGVAPEDLGATVHNIYWLNFAELGHFGLGAFVLLHFTPPILAFRAARSDGTVRGDLLLGFAAGQVALLLQGTLEWALRDAMVAEVIWVIFGIIAAQYRAGRAGDAPLVI